MVSSFDPHNMCAKVERITAKTGCTSCTNWTISFKVRGFQTKTHMFQRHFIFLNLFQLNTCFTSNMQHSKPHTEISTLLTTFAIFMHLMIYFELNDLEIGRGYNLNSEKVETWHWYHHLTHITCAQELRGLGQNWMHFVYKLDHLFQSTSVSDEKSSFTKTFH